MKNFFSIQLKTYPIPFKDGKFGVLFFLKNFQKLLDENGFKYSCLSISKGEEISILFKDIEKIQEFNFIKGPREDEKEKIEFFKKKYLEIVIKDKVCFGKIKLKNIKEIIEENFQDILKKIEFSKRMKWNSNETFIRPIREILYDSDLFEELNISYSKIKSQKTFFKENKSNFFENPFYENFEKEKIEELDFLLENPIPIEIKINNKFIEMGEEIIKETIWENQKALLKDKNTCIFFSEGVNVSESKIQVAINSKLLDAFLMWQRDLKKTKEEIKKNLKEMIFINNYSYFDKIKETQILLENFLKQNNETNMYSDIVFQYKSGITTEIANENHNFENIMSYFLCENKYKEIIKDINENQNLLISKLIVLSDNLKTIDIFISNDILPTSNKDPFGLKKKANIICNILLNEIYVDFENLVNKNTLKFLKERLILLLKNNLLPFRTDIDFFQIIKNYKVWNGVNFEKLLNITNRIKGFDLDKNFVPGDFQEIKKQKGIELINYVESFLEKEKITDNKENQYFIGNVLEYLKNIFII